MITATRERLLLLAAIMLLPALVYGAYYSGSVFFIWDNPYAHAIVEYFNIFVALLIFYVVHKEYDERGFSRAFFIGVAFFAAAFFGFFHAVSSPGYSPLITPDDNMTLWFESVRALLFAFFLALTTVRRETVECVFPADGKVKANVLVLGTLVFMGAVAAVLVIEQMPQLLTARGPTALKLALDVLSIAFLTYTIASYFRRFLKTNDTRIFYALIAMALLTNVYVFQMGFHVTYDIVWWTATVFQALAYLVFFALMLEVRFGNKEMSSLFE